MNKVILLLILGTVCLIGYSQKIHEKEIILRINQRNICVEYWGSFRNDTLLESRLEDKGPIIAAVDVYGDLETYQSGVYVHTSGQLLGGKTMLIVGYDESEQCWIMKNSWGSLWGDHGYYKLAYSETIKAMYYINGNLNY
jgi:hypothetical protein